MAMLDNKLVQIALVFVAFYIIMQIMNKNVYQENLDTVVTVSPESSGNTLVQVQSPTPPALTTSIPGVPAAANALVTPELAGSTGNASAVPVVTAAPSAAISGAKIPAALTSVEETLLAAAPPTVTNAEVSTKANQNIFAPEPTDLDAMFGRRAALDPAELIPKSQDVELYRNLVPDPKLNQNFLQNRWSLGIAVSKPKRGFINDLHGAAPNPVAVVSPWGQPTQFPDLYRKSLGEIS
ncbi:hypothetical protein HK104_000352 [Borealophlyctis nickersoniae]|nr:hypothetical protein HK104_000352 [Borealophlyctis nickersoniae]